MPTGPSRPPASAPSTLSGPRTAKTVQAVRLHPALRNASQASASGRPQGAVTASSSQLSVSDGSPKPRTSVRATIPAGSHNREAAAKPSSLPVCRRHHGCFRAGMGRKRDMLTMPRCRAISGPPRLDQRPRRWASSPAPPPGCRWRSPMCCRAWPPASRSTCRSSAPRSSLGWKAREARRLRRSGSTGWVGEIRRAHVSPPVTAAVARGCPLSRRPAAGRRNPATATGRSPPRASALPGAARELLEVEPEFARRPEEAAQAQCRVSGDGAAPVRISVMRCTGPRSAALARPRSFRARRGPRAGSPV